MRALVAGATGAIGRPLVARLLAEGHEVWGMSRSRQGAAVVDGLGAQGVVADALDADAVKRAVEDAEPEVVIQQLTALPQKATPKSTLAGYTATDRLRTEGTRHLLDAAPGARHTWYSRDGSIGQMIRKRRYPLITPGAGYSSWLHVDDAVSATVAALAGGPPGVYNVVDDHPAPAREWLPALAEALGAKSPLRIPATLAQLVAGRTAVFYANEVRGASNEHFKATFGWSPSVPDWRNGFRSL